MNKENFIYKYLKITAMDKQEFKKRMKAYTDEFYEKTWPKIVQDINQFKEENGEIDFYSSNWEEVEKLTDAFCMSGAWITDRLTGKSGNVHSKDYRGSLSKKIRKALGYTY